MSLRGTLFAGLLATSHAYSHQHSSGTDDHPRPLQHDGIKRVAVIGAGAGGASTAYHIRKFASEAGLPVNITLFDRNDYIGGRSTTVQAYDDPSSAPIELGASIFVEVNHILVDAVKEFRLNTQVPDGNGANIDDIEKIELKKRLVASPELGIWDGEGFVLTVGAGNYAWWDTAKLLWRYGLAPIKTKSLKDKIIGKFLQMYEEPYFPWPSLGQVTYELGLTAVTAATGEQYLKENEVGDLFAREVVQASTRVNYAQNLGRIHGLEALVCMATDGAMAVDGGNWQIFEQMAKFATSDIRLSTNVTGVWPQQDEADRTVGVLSSSVDIDGRMYEREELYDEVVLATPYQFSNIDFEPKHQSDRLPQHIPDEIPYVDLHVTLFASPHLLSPGAFNLSPDTSVPEVILTTLQPSEHPIGDGPDRAGIAGFFSISLLQPVKNPRNSRQEFVYKIFSPMEVDDTFLARILGASMDEQRHHELEKQDVTWIYRKLWHSYPYEFPRVTFEELRLDKGLWYTSGIESFISTMETSALMGKNIARLMVDGWVKNEGRRHGMIEASVAQNALGLAKHHEPGPLQSSRQHP